MKFKLFMMLICLASLTFAATITGHIQDVATGTAITGALVSIDGDLYLTTETDASGDFEITDFDTDLVFYLSVYAPGYQGHYETLTISGTHDMGDVELTELLYPATGIIAEHNGDNVDLSWEAPGTSLPDYFRYDNGLTRRRNGDSIIDSEVGITGFRLK